MHFYFGVQWFVHFDSPVTESRKLLANLGCEQKNRCVQTKLWQMTGCCLHILLSQIELAGRTVHFEPRTSSNKSWSAFQHLAV